MKTRDHAPLASVLIAFAVLCAVIGPYHPDRAFVTYRYADHLAGGAGIVYNTGEAPGEGYSNALWMFLCAAQSRLGLALPASAPVVAIALGLVALVLFWFCVRRAAGVATALTLSAFAALSGPLALAATSGEGVTLILALCLALVFTISLPMMDRRASIAAGILGALLAMCGIYYALVFPLLLANRLYRERDARAALPGGAVFLVSLIAYHAWRVRTLGGFFPHSVLAETARASLSDFFVVQPHDTTPFGLFYVLLLVAAVLGATRVRSLLHEASLLTAIVVGAVTVVQRDPLPGLASSAPLAILLMIPVAGLTGGVKRAISSRLLTATLIALVILTALGWSVGLRAFAGHIADAHDATLAPLGRWLATLRPNATLLTDTPGAIPYYTGWPTAVVTPSASDPPRNPDVVILTAEGLFDPVMAPAQRRIANALAGRYRVLANVRTEWVRDRALVIYLRADLPELTDAQRQSFPKGIGSIVRVNR